jgi:NRPS condensation-like uncharacterized protein
MKRGTDMKDQSNKWYRLDNQAKIFPEVYNKFEPHTFRIQISLSEEINPELLQQAVSAILVRFPMFKVRLRRGFFWTYLEENDKPFLIQPMPYNVCGYLDFKQNNDYLFKVFYRHKTIAVETFHTLTDGTGLTELVKSIAFEYLRLSGHKVTPDNMIKTVNETPIEDESEDSSKKYYNKKNSKRVKERAPIKLQGTTIYDFDIKLVSGIFSTKAIKEVAKANNATITEYIVAVMIYSIYKVQVQYRTQLKGNQHPIKLGLPVNLRTRFPSQTLRNFVNIISVEVDVEHDDVSFHDVLTQVQNEIKMKTTKEELIRIMSEYVSYEKNLAIRLVPSFIKRIVMKIVYSYIGSGLFTTSFSNVGRVVFPASVEPFIEDMSFMVGAGRNNRINTAVISVKDRFKVCFTSNIHETNIQKEFIRHFTNLGLQVEVESNYMEEQHEDM